MKNWKYFIYPTKRSNGKYDDTNKTSKPNKFDKWKKQKKQIPFAIEWIYLEDNKEIKRS
jgi:hypothetical protein